MSKDELRDAIPLDFACTQLGIKLDYRGWARCPWHADETASFHLWKSDDGVERYGCFPCNNTIGDVFDLIKRMKGMSFGESIEVARDFLRVLPPDWKRIELETSSREPQPELLSAVLLEGQERARAPENDGWLSVVGGLIPPPTTTKAQEFAQSLDAFLRDVWGWGVSAGGEILLPHWDSSGILTGIKIRDVRGDKYAVTGSVFVQALYGAWRPREHPWVLLTEGETDTIWATWQAQQAGLPVSVYSLPAGAGVAPSAELLTPLKGAKVVYLAFDADGPGVRATRAWWEYLRLLEVDVRVCRLPLGYDLRGARPDLRLMLRQARKPKHPQVELEVTDEAIERVNSKGHPRQLARWVIVPKAILSPADGEVDESSGLEVELISEGITRDAVLPLKELHSATAMRKWASARALAWQGNDSDGPVVAEWLLTQGAFLPEVMQAPRLGVQLPPDRYAYAGPTLVTPDDYIGKLPWRYVPPANGDVTAHAHFPTGDFDFRWLELLLQLHEPGVVYPLLAWMIAAARRTEVQTFPLLFLSGPSGCGKSTLAQLFSRLMGSSISAHLGQSTGFVLLAMMSTTTTVPVFIDEWTRKSKADALRSFQESIPAVYEGGEGLRGRSDQSIAHYKLSSPVIVAGEDSFSLDREAERMVTLALSRRGQNPDVLREVSAQPIERFARWFYTWLLQQPKGSLPPFPQGMPSRPEHNLGCLHTGWETLRLYLEHAAEMSYGDVPELPELDLSEAESSLAERENVYEIAVIEGAALREVGTQLPLVWEDTKGRGTWVRFLSLSKQLEARVDVELPGKSRAMRAYFEANYAVSDHRVKLPLWDSPVSATLITGFHLGDVIEDA